MACCVNTFWVRNKMHARLLCWWRSRARSYFFISLFFISHWCFGLGWQKDTSGTHHRNIDTATTTLLWATTSTAKTGIDSSWWRACAAKEGIDSLWWRAQDSVWVAADAKRMWAWPRWRCIRKEEYVKQDTTLYIIYTPFCVSLMRKSTSFPF